MIVHYFTKDAKLSILQLQPLECRGGLDKLGFNLFDEIGRRSVISLYSGEKFTFEF